MLSSEGKKLKEKLYYILQSIGHHNEVKKIVGEEFISRGMHAQVATNIFMNYENIYTVGESENDALFLFIFCMALNKAIERLGLEDVYPIDLNKYFTNLECKKWKDYQENREEQDNVYPVVFENVQQIGERIWQTVLTAQQLEKLNANNLILYNFKTQRNPKIRASGLEINFDKKKSIEISERMIGKKDGATQYPDHIKLNVLKNFEEKIGYNPNKQQLIIDKPSIVNIFDGYHRKVANSLALDEMPKLEFTWPLIIANLTEEEAREYMVQIDKQKPIKREQIQSWDLNRNENLVVSVIENDKLSKLNKVMRDQEEKLKYGNSLVTKNVISTAIKENYDLKEGEVRGIGNWIIEFTDYLMGEFKEHFRKENGPITSYKNTFYGYIALSSYLYYTQVKNWKDKTNKAINSIDFNASNSFWHDVKIDQRHLSKSARHKIYELFKSKAEEV